jgi:protein-S-isoprenylcysteine O-methyltransferase Ste14
VAGHFLWLKSIWMIAYALLAFAAVHAFVTLYEEPTLKEKFGAAYEDYLRRVPRWIPRARRVAR